MPAYIVSYDLHQPGQRYEKIESAISEFGEFAKVLRTTWIVNTINSLNHIKTMLEIVSDSNDKIIIVELGSKAASLRLDYVTEQWLRNHHFSLE